MSSSVEASLRCCRGRWGAGGADVWGTKWAVLKQQTTQSRTHTHTHTRRLMGDGAQMGVWRHRRLLLAAVCSTLTAIIVVIKAIPTRSSGDIPPFPSLKPERRVSSPPRESSLNNAMCPRQ